MLYSACSKKVSIFYFSFFFFFFHEHISTQNRRIKPLMISGKTVTTIQKILHPHIHARKGTPPALSFGLCLFLSILLILGFIFPSWITNLKLNTGLVKNWELNRLTWYPMFHYNVLHFLLNLWFLYPALALFERNNGTVRTAIVLNALATIAGVLFTVSQLILLSDASILGARYVYKLFNVYLTGSNSFFLFLL